MAISKPIKCILAVIFSFFLGVMIMGSAYEEGPILDNGILPGYYLYGLDSAKQDISEYIKDDHRFKRFKKIKSVKCLDEMWLTVTKKEAWDSFFDKKKREELKSIWSSVTVTRYYLDNKEEATEWAKLLMESISADIMPLNEKHWKEGGYSIEKIGDKSWTDKPYMEYLKSLGKGNGLTLYFVKDNIVVEVGGAGPDNNPMDPLFIEKIAKAVESRL